MVEQFFSKIKNIKLGSKFNAILGGTISFIGKSSAIWGSRSETRDEMSATINDSWILL